MFVYLFACLLVCLFVCLSVCLYVNLCCFILFCFVFCLICSVMLPAIAKNETLVLPTLSGVYFPSFLHPPQASPGQRWVEEKARLL